MQYWQDLLKAEEDRDPARYCTADEQTMDVYVLTVRICLQTTLPNISHAFFASRAFFCSLTRIFPTAGPFQIRDASRPNESGLLRAIMKQYMSGTCSLRVFGLPLVQVRVQE